MRFAHITNGVNKILPYQFGETLEETLKVALELAILPLGVNLADDFPPKICYY